MTIAAWKARPVFISSTFRDMHAERDYLRNNAFLLLGEQLHERCHFLDTIDLRQGVENAEEADEAQREMQVLKVCLNEIDRSKPFLVALLGDRYGWIPPPERITAAAREAGLPNAVEVAGRSVTELEILYGVLENQDQLQRSWFYFRTLDRSGMPPEVAAHFPAEEPSDDPESPAGRLRALKDRIRKDMPDRVREYTLKWNPEKKALIGLKEFDQQVAKDLWSDLGTETEAFLRDAPSTWQEADERAVADFVTERTRGYVERPAVTDPMIAHALSPAAPDAEWGLVATGGSGSGKSSIFGRVMESLQPRAEAGELVLLSHAAGIFPLSGQVDRMLRRWVTDMAGHLEIPDPLEQAAESPGHAEEQTAPGGDKPIITSKEIEETFTELLGQLSVKIRVVVVIDALNQFEPSARAQHMAWLPKLWPDNARFLATAIPGTASGAFRERPGSRELPVPPVTREEAGQIAERFFQERYHRAVNPRVMEVLLDKELPDGEPAHGNPLWLALALQEMNLLEADDYERAEREYANLPGAERMEALQLEEVDQLSAELHGIYGELLARAERGFGKPWVDAFTGLIAISRAGWRESDLRVLMPRVFGRAWDDLAFAAVRRILGMHVVQRGSQAQWDFFHATLREKILNQDLADESIRRHLHGLIADHLEELLPEDPLRISETMVHLVGLGDRDRAAGYLASNQSRQESSSHTSPTLTGAVAVLVEFIHAAKGEQERDRLTNWIAGLLDGGDDERTGRIAHVILCDLNIALEVSGATQTETPRRYLLDSANQVFSDLFQRNPQSANYAIHLSVSYSRLGDFHRGVGDEERALACHEKSLALSEDLRKRNPQSADYARNLSVSYNKLGDLYLGQGDGERALAFHEKSLAISEDLRKRNPQSADYAADLAVCYESLGDLYLGRGDGERALAFHEKSLAISEDLQKRNPQSTVYARDLSVSYNKLGDLYLGRGDEEQALAFYEKSLVLSEDLRKRNPQNADYARNLSVSYGKLGGLYRGRGDGEQTQAFYEKSLALSEDLRKRNPQSAYYAGDLSLNYSRLGDLYRELGDGERALTFYEKSLALRENLRKRNPQSMLDTRAISLICSKLGDMHRESGDLEQALTLYEKSLALGEDLQKRNPQSTVYARDLSVNYDKLGNLHRGLGDGERALAFYEKSLTLREDLRKINPQNVEYSRALSASYWRMALMAEESGQGDAMGWRRKAYEIMADMKQRGILLPTDEQHLANLKKQVGAQGGTS